MFIALTASFAKKKIITNLNNFSRIKSVIAWVNYHIKSYVSCTIVQMKKETNLNMSNICVL